MENMSSIRTLVAAICAMICMTGLAPLAFAQSAPSTTPVRVAPADAKNHIGSLATVCGKVVDARIGDPGIAGRGKPITFNLDAPQPNQVFSFVTFGAQPGGFPEAKAAIAAYQDKQVCVTGKINAGASATPFIFAVDHAQIKVQAESK
jgi:hypothetical protein